MAHDSKAIIDGRGEVQTLDPRQQADLLRALVERTTRNATPAARRRAIALAGARLARAAGATERGKA